MRPQGNRGRGRGRRHGGGGGGRRFGGKRPFNSNQSSDSSGSNFSAISPDKMGQTTASLLTLSNLRRNMDINCDVAQGIGVVQYPYEEEMLKYVTSVNIACGGHAGDPKNISRMISLAKENNVNTGALIGYPDIIGNGQREMYLDVDELRSMVLYQLGAINALLHAKGMELRHVRTHGFLYRQMYTDQLVADTVAKAISEFSHWITLVGLAGPVLQRACINANIKIGQEVLVDRRYRNDGTVLPYSEAIDGKDYVQKSIERAKEIIQNGEIECEGAGTVKLNPNTVHIPSNRADGVELARAIRALIPDPKPINLDRYDEYFADLKSLIS